MRKIKEILRLHWEQKLSQRQISRGAGVSQSTVHEYITRAQSAGLTWPLPEDWDEDRLEAALYPANTSAAAILDPVVHRPQPDFAHVQQQLACHRELTLELLWEEYCEQNAARSYSYSRFCKLYRRWKGKRDVVLRQEHRPGEKLFVDWAGATIPIHHADGTITLAALFVSALGVFQLHLRRGRAQSTDGTLAQSADERAGVLRWRSAVDHSRQHENRRHQGVPLRT